MFFYYFRDLTLGTVMILSFGPQNVLVMNQGIRRQYHVMTASLCAVNDLVLICAGTFGGSTLLMQSPWLLALVARGGVASLLWYGFGAFKTVIGDNTELANAEVLKQGGWKIIVTMLAVTWLNPHVYLDTFAALDSLSGQLGVEPKCWSTLGITSASFLWFFGPVILAAWLTPRPCTARSQRIISLVVECIMWFITLQLARDGTVHAQALFSWVLSDEKIKQRR